jgi:chaperonin GroEL
MEETGRKLQDCTVADCGRVSKLTVEKERTVLVGGAGKKAAIQERVRQIQAQIERTTSEYDREKLEERLAKLAGGVAVIKVGGATESEMKERKDRVDDALHATRAAREEGVVPGGGVALLRASAAVEAVMKAAEGDAKLGADVVLRALKAPARLIADNAGFDGSLVVEEILDRKGWNGFNALTGEYEDMGKSGVLDPAKVVRAALQNAASIAGMLLTTNTLVADLKDDAKEPVAGAVA